MNSERKKIAPSGISMTGCQSQFRLNLIFRCGVRPVLGLRAQDDVQDGSQKWKGSRQKGSRYHRTCGHFQAKRAQRSWPHPGGSGGGDSSLGRESGTRGGRRRGVLDAGLL